MRAWACRLGPSVEEGRASSLALLLPRGVPAEAASAGPFAAAATAAPDALRPLLARRGPLVAVGDVRLDDPAALEAPAGPVPPDASHLDRVLATWEARGPAALDALTGDFALAVWDGRTETLTAARDPFGVKALFVARKGDALLLSSRLAALAGDAPAPDEEFAADFLVGGAALSARTVWSGCEALGAGEAWSWRGGAATSRRLWDAAELGPEPGIDPGEAVEAFRALLEEAVRVRAVDERPVWAQLSGGLDSSSVVSLAAALARRGDLPAGPGGTVTMADTLGDGDERAFSDAVVRRWGLPNRQVVDAWPWEDDGRPPIATDEPRSHFPFWTRDRRMADAVRAGGGRVLLSGQGADHYLTGPPVHAADLLASGRAGEAARLLLDHAVAERGSFWTALGRHGLLPLLPAAARRRRTRRDQAVPDWLEPAWARRLEVAGRLPALRDAATPHRGSRFHRMLVAELRALPGFVERGTWEEGIEMRYPFLHRPLVELALRLPPELRVRPEGGKWVLREAMRGVLPETVRVRRGKGGIDARLLWALEREAPRLRALLRDPLLARLGWVRADRLRAAVEAARQGEVANLPFLLCTLSLETWFAVRDGRWAAIAEEVPRTPRDEAA